MKAIIFGIIFASLPVNSQSLGPTRVNKAVSGDRTSVFFTIGNPYATSRRYRVEIFGEDWRPAGYVFTPRQQILLPPYESRKIFVVVSLKEEHERTLRVCLAEDPRSSMATGFGAIGRACSMVHLKRTDVAHIRNR